MSIIIKFSFSVSVNDSRYIKGDAKKKALGRSCKFRESTPTTRTKFWLNYNGQLAKFEPKRLPRSGLSGYRSKTRIETRTRVIFNQLFLQYNMIIFFLVLTNYSTNPSVVSSVRNLIAEGSSGVIFGLGIEEISEQKMSNRNTETRSLMDELRSFEKGGFFDLGHPLLNRIAESFVKAAGIGAIQAVSREAYFTAIESAGIESGGGMPSEISGGKKHRLPDLKGETNRKSLEAMVKNTGKESIQWGLAAGVYSGLTYGLTEARGAHDWKNSAVAGAVTGVALALISEDSSHEQIVQCAITGAAISTAANLLAGIF